MINRFLLSLLFCISAGLTVSAASVSAAQDGNEDDGATTSNMGLLIDFESLDSTAAKRLTKVENLVVVRSTIDPTGIGGSVGDGPRVPTDVFPGKRPNKAPEVTPTSDGTTGDIANNNAVTAFGSFDATEASLGNQSSLGPAAKIPVVFIKPGIPVVPDGVGGHVSSDDGGPKPTLPSKPSRPSGSRKYSDGNVTVEVGGDSGSGSPGSYIVIPDNSGVDYAPSVNGVNITNLIPVGSKKDLGSVAALIDMILEIDPDLDINEVATMVNELLAR
jgi:hypothetical protein